MSLWYALTGGGGGTVVNTHDSNDLSSNPADNRHNNCSKRR